MNKFSINNKQISSPRKEATHENIQRIAAVTTHKILLLAKKDEQKYRQILGSLQTNEVEDKIKHGIEFAFLPGFITKAYLSNQWKNGDNKTLTYKKWSNANKLTVTFKISKSRGISGLWMASFTLINIDII